jgi:hypothetical protein
MTLISPGSCLGGVQSKMAEKEKILIFISSDLYGRNFVSNGAFDEISKRYQVYYALTKNKDFLKVDVSTFKNTKESNIYAFSYSYDRLMKFYYFTELDMVRLRNKCSTFEIKCDFQLPRRRRLFYKILSLPFIYPMIFYLFMKYMGRHGQIDEILHEVKPDLVIIPTSLIDSVSTDVIISCKNTNIKTLMLINGWDNISSKGTIPMMPDYLGVWGEQNVNHAVELHNISRDRVSALGVPQFRQLYEGNTQSRESFRIENSLPINKKVLLFAGSCRVFDETSLLLKLDHAIEAGELPDIHILYRPHPWRHPRIKEDSFFDYDFKNVTMDSTLADSYKLHKSDPDFQNLPHNVLPELDRYVNLYHAVDGVICTLTTVMVEAAIMGIPVLAIAFSDGVHSLTMDTLIKNKHFDGIQDIPGIIVTHDQDRFIHNCRDLLEIIDKKDLKKSLQSSIGYIAYSNSNTYAQRLLDLIDKKIFMHKGC